MRLAFIVIFIGCLLGCQTPVRSGSQCVVPPGYLDHQVKFTWHSDVAVDLDDRTGYVSPLALMELEQAVIAEMESKRFSFVVRNGDAPEDQSADLTIALTLRVRRELVSYESHADICADTDCWERIDTGASTRMDLRTIGFLAADMYYLDEPIWRGWVETNLFTKDRDATGDVVGRVVPQLFETFPP